MRLLILSSPDPKRYGGSKPEVYERMRAALERAGIEAIHRFVTTRERLVEDLEELRPDLVYAAIDRTIEEDGWHRISELLEEMGLPYVGSDPVGLETALFKDRAKSIWVKEGIRTPEFFVLSSPSDLPHLSPDRFPVIVKPLGGGGSRGITESCVAFNLDQLKKAVDEMGGELIVERYIRGREFTVSIIGNGGGKLIAPSELVPRTRHRPLVITYQIKEGPVGTRPVEPEPVEGERLRKELAGFAEAMFDSCGLRDYGRADIIMDERGEMHAIEINAQPVFESYFLTGFRPLGLGFDEVVNLVIYASILRHRLEGRGIPTPPLIGEVVPIDLLRRLSVG